MERLLLLGGVHSLPGKLKPITLASLTGAALGAAFIGVWAKNGAQPILAPQRHPATLMESHSQSSAETTTTFLPEAGKRYIYQFERRIAFEGQVAGASLPDLSYSGEFYVDVLRADSRSFEALIFQRVKEAGSRLSPPVRIEADARGENLALFTEPKLNEDQNGHVSVLKDLAALWIFPLRSDTVGPYDARFDPLPAEKGSLRAKKVKLAYLKRGANVPEVLESEHLLHWDTLLHLPKEVGGKERTRLGSAGAQALTAASRYHLKFKSWENAPSYEKALLARLSEESPLALQAKADPRQHPDYAKLNWNEVMNRLRNLENLDGGQQLEAFGDLVKLLKMHPERIVDIAALLRDPNLLRIGAESPLFRTLVGALATQGSPEALALLREAYEDPALSREARTTILAALTTTQAPLDSPTRDFLANKMVSEKDGHLAQSAAFALGSSLQNSPNDAQSARGIAQIESAWKAQGAGDNLGAKLALLDVMGNSGREEFFPKVQEVIDGSAETRVKARAVFALRFMTSDLATQSLLQHLRDPVVELREAAARALSQAEWKEAFRSPLGHCVSNESESRVRDHCRKTLDNHPTVAGNN